MSLDTRGTPIPLTIGLACLNYALFMILAGTPFGFFLRMDFNLETALLALALWWLPLAAFVGIAARSRVGWYAGLALPVLYFAAAVTCRVFAARGITYHRFYDDFTKEYFFSGRDGMQWLAGVATLVVIMLIPAILLLLTPTARRAIFGGDPTTHE
ncbi:MAG TPA: hypothetical protein PLZ36_17545 [Armatimonadota bacterium]|nr:hypothetical protein [Armatimonadota bacterium]HOS44093.1 hypothetical protein [Armatimonadota bacterium]